MTTRNARPQGSRVSSRTGGGQVAEWRNEVLKDQPATSAASEIGSVATSIAPSDSVSQVEAKQSHIQITFAGAPRGRDGTPKKLTVNVERSSPLRMRLASDKGRGRARSRSRNEDEEIEGRPYAMSIGSRATAPASSTAVDSAFDEEDERKGFRQTKNVREQ